MNRKCAIRWGATGIAAAALCLSVVFTLRYSGEPSYGGKTLRAWLRSGRDIRSPDFTQASNAVCAIGTNAIPHLLRLVQKKDPNLTWRLKQFASSHALMRFEDPLDLRYDAVTGFFILGTGAIPAIPELARLAVEQDNEEAGRSIIVMGRPAVPSLKQMLKNPNRRYRHLAIYCLMHSDCDTVEGVVPVLLQLMQDDDWQVRSYSGYMLEYYFNPQPWMSQGEDKGMPVLQPRTNVPDQRIFYDALVPRLQDTQQEVRVMAEGLLGRLRSVAKPVVP
jgi:hypothetical protein